jgi:hypothetical protein
MRFVFIFVACLVIFSCVKKQSTNPVPAIDYKSFVTTTNTTSESATLTLSYEDGDGDLFRDNNSDGPNLIYTIYIYNPSLKQFLPKVNIITQDTDRVGMAITQPGEGYKGKQVKGDIIWPMSQFRPNTITDTVFFYKLFMVDMKGNKSNMVTTPTFTVK